MKKLAIILLGLFPLVLSSCLKEEEDYFDIQDNKQLIIK